MFPALILVLAAAVGSFVILGLTGHVSFAEALNLPDEAVPLMGKSLLKRTNGPPLAIRVGVFYSNEALLEYGSSSANISAVIHSAARGVEQAVLPGSGLGAVNFSLCFPPRSMSAAFRERGSPGDTLRAFSQSTDALAHPECTNLVLFTTLRGLGMRACGIGFLPGRTAAVAGLCFDENLSFAHELGHNYGMTHGAGFATSDGRFRSVMAYRSMCRGKNPCERIPRYSSEHSSTWHGVRIGSVNADNANKLN